MARWSQYAPPASPLGRSSDRAIRTSVHAAGGPVRYTRRVPDFELVAPFQPTGDQPTAIERLSDGLAAGERHQTLLGVTGSGKTWTMANVIQAHNKPTLVLAHNKTLAAQLYAEFRE